jgi:hypothetical protein
MLHFYRALSALVALNWKIQGVGSIISPSTVRIVIVGVQPRFAVRGSLLSNIGRDVIGSPQHRFPAIATWLPLLGDRRNKIEEESSNRG